MKLNRTSKPFSARRLDLPKQGLLQSAALQACRSAIEPLEDRQMLSVTLDLRTNIGTKQAVVTFVGQVVTMDLYAVITGTKPADSTVDGMLSATGSFLSTKTNASGSVAGNLGNPNVNPDYGALGAAEGTVQDLNGDGNTDIGSNNNADIAGFWNDRAGGLQTDGTISGNSSTYYLGSVDYTVTALHSGQETDVNFRLRQGIAAGAFDAVWEEDGIGKNDQIGTALVGTPVTFTDPNLTVQTGSISGTVSKVVSGSTSSFAGVTVYLDTNNNGVLDSGEPSAVTTSTGAYSFTQLAPASYFLRQVVPTGYTQTAPANTPSLVTVGSGKSVTGQNFTDTAVTTKTSSIAGTVSKVVSGVTSGFSGVTVYLDNDGSGTFNTGDTSTTTSSSGAYSFTGLAAGTYQVREVVPSGYTQTSPSTTPTTITLTTGQASTGDNFTDTAATVVQTASISGTVSKIVGGVTSVFSGVTMYLDSNNNGTLDSGEKSVTTSSNGTYTLTGLAAGTYFLRELIPSNYTLTTPSTQPVTIVLTTGQTVVGQNFFDTANAVTTGGSSISGTVYVDSNKNGKLDSGEVGIPNVTIYYDANNDSIPDAGDTILTTSATGTYSFTGLAAGTYLIREVVPTGSKLTSPSKGYVNVGVGSNWVITGENWGNTAPTVVTTGTISGTVSKVVSGNNSAFSGVTVFLDTNGNGVLDSGEKSTTTSSTGSYSFTGLSAGNYAIAQVVPSGYTQTSPTGEIPVTVTANGSLTGENFVDTASNVVSTGSISGTVTKVVSGVSSADSGVTMYLDINNDGSFDTGDISTTTSSTGAYTFSGLAAGTYRVRQVLPSGYSQTSPTTTPTTVTLTTGQTVTGQNFTDTAASTSTAITLSGVVFNDKNGNGVMDSGESGLSGWTVYCDLNNDGKFETNESYKVTPSNGKYSFTALKPGTYTLRIVPQAGYKATLPASGFYTVVLTAGSNIVENFGEESTLTTL